MDDYKFLSKERRVRSLIAFILLCSAVFLSACGMGQIDSAGEDADIVAVWDDQAQMLNVSGNSRAADQSVEIHDAATMQLLGAATVQADGHWAATASTAACSVHVSLPKGTQTLDVQNAPSFCTAKGVEARVAASNSVPANVLVVENPQLLNTVPNAVIISPPNDVTIQAGESVTFLGTATGTSIAPPISYFWNFAGMAPNSSVQNPGSIRFTQPGNYLVQLSASDNLGIPDPTPATRMIRVVGNNNVPNAAPVPSIISPQVQNGIVNINVGDSLFFSGTATDGTVNSEFFFEWFFSGAIPNQSGPTPGNVRFNNAGTYLVQLYATSLTGLRSASPATLTVIVGFGNGGGGFNQAPDGYISSPNQDMTITVGDSVNFRAQGSDPDNNTPLTYSWEFDGVAPDILSSTNRTAGNVTFNQPGIFIVEMTVSDALGAQDPTPATRVITVQNPVGGNNPLADAIVSPPSDVTLVAGQSVFFSASPPLAAGQGPFQYFWSFDNAVPNSTQQTPGDITFALPGTYQVRLFIANAAGVIIGAPSARNINVVSVTGGSTPTVNQASIVSPADGSVISVGAPVSLQANVSDLSALTNISYEWKVRERGTNTTIYTASEFQPPPFTFSQAGSYQIKFRVRGTDPFTNNAVSIRTKVSVTVIGSTIPGSNIPNASIIESPSTDQIILQGDSIRFRGATIVGSNVQYLWTFNGQANDSFSQNPPRVTFNQLGTFIVRLRVTGIDSLGQPINLTEERFISVSSGTGNNPFPPLPPGNAPVSGVNAPEGIIDQPAGNLTIRAGQSVQFSGRGFDPLGGGQLDFLWNFAGAAPNARSQFPGTITFRRVGNYVVSLLVINAQGQIDPTPATVVITVTP